MDKDGVFKKLHEIKIAFNDKSKDFNIGLTGVLSYYAATSFSTVDAGIGLSPQAKREGGVTLAHFNPDDNEIYVSAIDGFIPKSLSNYFNLSSVLKHEKNHKDDFASGIPPSFASHFQVYSNQLANPLFTLTDEDFQFWQIGSALNYLFNGYNSKTEDVSVLISLADEFKNALEKKGFTYTVNYKLDKNGQYNDVESFTITKINSDQTKTSKKAQYTKDENHN